MLEVLGLAGLKTGCVCGFRGGLLFGFEIFVGVSCCFGFERFL
jgi:hypothetical protein